MEEVSSIIDTYAMMIMMTKSFLDLVNIYRGGSSKEYRSRTCQGQIQETVRDFSEKKKNKVFHVFLLLLLSSNLSTATCFPKFLEQSELQNLC